MFIEIICSVLYSILVKTVRAIYKFWSKTSHWLAQEAFEDHFNSR